MFSCQEAKPIPRGVASAGMFIGSWVSSSQDGWIWLWEGKVTAGVFSSQEAKQNPRVLVLKDFAILLTEGGERGALSREKKD